MKKALTRLAIGMIPSRKTRKRLRAKYLSPTPDRDPMAFTASRPPINIVPEPLQEEFTLNGRIPVLYTYFNDSAPVKLEISEKNYESTIRQINEKTFRYYDNSMDMFYDALSLYPLTGKKVIIWGLASCNCDALALWNNAEKVIVVDYNKPICHHDKVTVMSHRELTESGMQADCAISFSSFEHDGLGRYGDPIAPNGDLQAMKEARKHLVPGGLLYLGLPMGPDCLVWNAHRIYGKARLPLMLEGWECVGAFGPASDPGSPPFYERYELGKFFQPLLVVRSICQNSENSPNGENNSLKPEGLSTFNGKLLREVRGLHFAKVGVTA